MSKSFSSQEQYLDAKSIPKFQFELLDQELISCIKQLYLQSKSQQKSILQIKKDVQQKLTVQNYIRSLKHMHQTIAFPRALQSLVPASIKSKEYNDPLNPVLTQTFQLSNKFSIFSEILSILNSKMLSLQKRVTISEQKTNQMVKQKVSSVEQQLVKFVQDYRTNFKDLSAIVSQSKTAFENKAKQIQTNTLWKINQCSKRLEDRPNLEMVKNSISQVEIKLSRMIQSAGTSSSGSGYAQTTKIEQDIIKMKKLIDFNQIQAQSQIKTLNEKLNSSFMSLKSYADQKLQITKKFENLNIAFSDLARKAKQLQNTSNRLSQQSSTQSQSISNINDQIKKINTNIEKFTKTDEFAKLLQKIDPHELCRISSVVRILEDKSITTDQRIESLGVFVQALRGKMQFWNMPTQENPEKSDHGKVDMQLLAKLIKDEIANSQFKKKLDKFEHQILDLTSLKEGINDILKKLSRINKDNDLTSFKYEIQGVQEYTKRQILILSNKINILENMVNANDKSRRPMSARGKNEDNKLTASLSTKKLLPASCISCYHTNGNLPEKQKRTFFNSKFVIK